LHCHIDTKTNKKQYAQHNILYDKNHSSKYIAGYIVPCFITNEELYYNLNNNTLLNNSYFIKPHHKILDEKYHYYSFDKKFAFQHSLEPKEDEIQSLEAILAQIEDNNKYDVQIKDFIEDITSILENYNIDNKEGMLRKVYPLIAYKLLQ